MKLRFVWDHEKNEQLKSSRDISFEEIIASIDCGGLLDDIEHPNKKAYPHQSMLVVSIKNYVYLVPYIKQKEGNLFLVTIFPSRKAKRDYGGE